ncbi:L-ascorbate metabolism protein UlaG (beta-lactamase superfamily) [Shimia isoporae]|uniref:L-ascorbate metabolism protein UlaG (Beta-lactamase superfamily) n=1 Tax=Shimia isoporae TaxID=647720 RepID=A0A4R1NKU4_9RHOB|nr:MBL fold metallo-hydrolase [Shimia isoporae]TCL08946.1 L-ascorbate metabolism protein UlaG (beta-lactamase superfamily) [Shimia isoporae]
MRVFLFFFSLVLATAAHAQDRKPSHCIALAQVPGISYVHKATYREPVEKYAVRISYLGHASFLIQSDDGIDVITDYTGFIGVTDLVPEVVTMNHAHDTHWTAAPDPRIPHVLPGWGPYGKGIQHHLEVGSMLVRNVSTDIRSFGGVEEKGNSIFIFEVSGLCIGHLGHLHHEPNEAQYAALGRLDVVMAAVDGGMSLDVPTMMRVLKRLRAQVVIPMHWFEDWTLTGFLQGMSEDYVIDRSEGNSLEVSLRTLPSQPTIKLLYPRYLQDP